MAIRVVTEPAAEPVVLSDVKLHLRVDESNSEENNLITALIVAARQWCENYTGRPIGVQTIEETFSGFPPVPFIGLKYRPINSIEAVNYTDAHGTTETLDANSYVQDTSAGCVVLKPGLNWPSFEPYIIEPVKVRYTAGYTTVPQTIKQAILLLVGHWYENREAAIVGLMPYQIQFSVKALLDQYRVRWWT